MEADRQQESLAFERYLLRPSRRRLDLTGRAFLPVDLDWPPQGDLDLGTIVLDGE